MLLLLFILSVYIIFVFFGIFLYIHTMKNEIWKDIKGYEGLYQVSNLGNVRSLNYNGVKGNIRILTPIQIRGYLCVHLSKDGFVKIFKIHRLVAETFIPNPDKLPCVNHKSEKSQNYVWVNEDETIDLDKSSLEWCTIDYNNKYNDRSKKACQKTNAQKQKQVKQMTLDGQLITIWPSTREAERNGFSSACIGRCCQGKQKAHKGYLWEYV